MNNQTRRRLSIFVLLAWGGITTQLYQNCSPLQQFEMNDFASLAEVPPGHETGAGSGSHPVETKPELPTRKQHVVTKSYVAALFREIFTSTAFPVTDLEGLIDKWVVYKGAQYGGACNIYSSYTSKDCNGALSNVNLDYFTDNNTVRESFRIQLCENVLGLNNGVSAALEKVSLKNSSEINAASITAAYGLFYRNGPPETLVVNTLLDLNNTLAADKVTVAERWRAMLGQICESPAWQLF
ncbi:hypothetical protein D3C87_377230 [compost metagenome]